MSASSSSTAFQNEKQSIAEDPNSGTDVKPVSIFSNDYKKLALLSCYHYSSFSSFYLSSKQQQQQY